MAFALRCYTCRKRFKWDLTENGWPDACPLCGASTASDREDDDIVMPFVRSPKTDRTDKLYRDMEKGSEVRAELAAQAAGCDVSEMASLKMTDMKDNLRPGDIAAADVPNIGQKFVGGGSEYAAGISTGVVAVNGQITTGIEPRAGIRAMSTIQGMVGKSA